jgi:hypothetical protein
LVGTSGWVVIVPGYRADAAALGTSTKFFAAETVVLLFQKGRTTRP